MHGSLVFPDERREKREGGEPQPDLHRGPEERDEHLERHRSRPTETPAGTGANVPPVGPSLFYHIG